MKVPVIRLGGGDFFCLSATEFAHDICKGSHRVPSKVGRGLSFKVNTEFSCDGIGKMVYLMDERVACVGFISYLCIGR